MTDLVTLPSVALPSAAARARRGPSRRLVLSGTLVGAAFAGVALGATHPAEGLEPALTLLLRFMAVCKAAAVVGAAALVAWRCGRPLAPAPFAGYLLAVTLMGVAPGFIWFGGLIAPGALVFHAGLLGFLVLAARDDGVASAFVRRRR